MSWLDKVKWDAQGLVPAIAQEQGSGDGDVVLLQVTQLGHHPGIACHTGRHSCFFRELKTDAWVAIDPVLKDPGDIYKQGE